MCKINNTLNKNINHAISILFGRGSVKFTWNSKDEFFRFNIMSPIGCGNTPTNNEELLASYIVSLNLRNAHKIKESIEGVKNAEGDNIAYLETGEDSLSLELVFINEKSIEITLKALDVYIEELLKNEVK